MYTFTHHMYTFTFTCPTFTPTHAHLHTYTHRYSNSDGLLAHLLSFSATPTYHTLPQTLQDGMPLFYLQPNQTKPVSTAPLVDSTSHPLTLSEIHPGTFSWTLDLRREVRYHGYLL